MMLMPSPTLEELPSEIILHIGQYLDATGLNSLLRTGRRFHCLFQSRLYQLARKYRDVPVAGTPLIWAVQNGMITLLTRLLEGNHWPSDNQNGTTAVHQAIMCENEQSLRILLNAGADILIKDGNGDLPLSIAVEDNQESAVDLLLNAHAKLQPWSAFETQWEEVLTRAVRGQHKSICRLLLQHPLQHDANTGSIVNDALHLVAAFGGDCGIIRLLCDYGANPSSTTSGDRTLLHVAAFQGHLDVVNFGLEYGVDPSVLNHEGLSALHLAASSGHLQVTQTLLDAGVTIDIESIQGLTPLMSAASGGKKEVAQCLLNGGANIRARDQGDFHILDLAIANGTATDMVALFLEHGADASAAPEKPRMTPLHWAARAGNTDAIALLYRAGAPVNRIDQRGRTALHLAVREGHTAAIDALLTAGADASAQDETGSSPLHIVAVGDRTAVAQLLLEAGANVQAEDSVGHTPFHRAVMSAQIDLCRILLHHCQAHSLDYLSRCHGGRSVFEEAAENGHTAIMELLLDAGVDPNAHWESSSALHMAAAKQWAYHTGLLLSHGADPYALDLYGRSSLDWASTHSKTLQAMLYHCGEHRSTDPTERQSRLRKTVAVFARRLLNEEKSMHGCNSCTAAKALLLLGDEQAAGVLYSHDDDGDLHPPWLCSMCCRSSGVVSSRFVCRSCREIELCSACIGDSVQQRSKVLGCEGHEYFEVSEEGVELLEEQEIGRPAAWRRWLERLVTVYEDGCL